MDVRKSVPESMGDAAPVSVRECVAGKLKSILKVNKTRRSRGGKKSSKKANHQVQFSLLGNNANGIKAKRESLLNTLKFFNMPSCVLLQETKLRFNGTFNIKGYQIFEKVRPGLGGGLMTGFDEDLSPMLISSVSEETEILVVQIEIGRQKIRIFNAYGP